MGGFFGVASKKSCVSDLFFGVDYHSHLGPRRGGLAVFNPEGCQRSIHNIENSPFRSKFEKELERFTGNIGIGCISDYEPQPLLFSSHLGSFAISTVGRCTNIKELKQSCFENGITHFSEMSGGEINITELMAAIITQKATILEGLIHLHEVVRGTMSVLVMTRDGIYCSRDKLGRLPVIIGKKEDAYCVTFESSAFLNLGYQHVKDLGPGEIAYITADECFEYMDILTNAMSRYREVSDAKIYFEIACMRICNKVHEAVKQETITVQEVKEEIKPIMQVEEPVKTIVQVEEPIIHDYQDEPEIIEEIEEDEVLQIQTINEKKKSICQYRAFIGGFSK